MVNTIHEPDHFAALKLVTQNDSIPKQTQNIKIKKIKKGKKGKKNQDPNPNYND